MPVNREVRGVLGLLSSPLRGAALVLNEEEVHREHGHRRDRIHAPFPPGHRHADHAESLGQSFLREAEAEPDSPELPACQAGAGYAGRGGRSRRLAPATGARDWP